MIGSAIRSRFLSTNTSVARTGWCRILTAKKTFINDYIGREILELLQNANDAAAKAGKARQVSALNSCLPASSPRTPALRSRRLVSGRSASLTPAQNQLKAHRWLVIKGLGFRAVINWTRFPTILSADLAIVFSAKVAKQKQAQLAGMSEGLANCIERQKSLVGELVVPCSPSLAFAPIGT